MLQMDDAFYRRDSLPNVIDHAVQGKMHFIQGNRETLACKMF